MSLLHRRVVLRNSYTLHVSHNAIRLYPAWRMGIRQVIDLVQSLSNCLSLKK